jgi:hypothetical protein
MSKQCPITRSQFTSAKPMTVPLAGTSLVASPREFSKGSLGFYANGKGTVIIDGVPCAVQIGCTITVIGSKELSREAAAA